MTEDDIRAYLIRWVMEFGTGPVGAERYGNNWYGLEAPWKYNHPNSNHFYHEWGRDVVQINQAGLDLIKGDTNEQL